MIGWLLGIKTYLIAIAAALMIASIWLYVHGAEKAKEQVIVLETKLAQAEGAAKQNDLAFAECQKANAQNKQEADAQKTRAIEAEKRNAALKALADRGAKDIEREADTYRAAGLECPAVNAAFRDWLQGD